MLQNGNFLHTHAREEVSLQTPQPSQPSQNSNAKRGLHGLRLQNGEIMATRDDIAGKFAALILGVLRTAATVADHDEQSREDFLSRLAFGLRRPELLPAFVAMDGADQRRVLSAMDAALGSI